ncbi:hypothetical protein SDC9_37735 [bioreactor metagenome]|uniref:Uncharacterized protein n=1 Tax=bioreactor metagenome TaxID=1076179 RepID=A0A644VJT8_9ZZZZ
MEKVNKKEIRLTYYLNNEEDRKIYEELSLHTQPGRVVKDIVSKALKQNSNTNTDVNLETLKLLEKLTDKIENLKIETVLAKTSNKEDEDIQEIELTADVDADDIDIDF